MAQIGSDSFPAFVKGTQILEFAASRGILLIASPPYTQKLNPVEGIIKILVRMALAMLRHAGAPRSLVEFALIQATMLLNRLPRARKGERKLVVPLHRWLGMEPPSVLHVLKVWGCTAYALIHTGRGKFDSKVERLIHLGYDVARSAYILCSLPHFNISYSAHVTFNEDDFPLRQACQPDPVPSSLFEEGMGRVNQEVVGGDWGRAREAPNGPGKVRIMAPESAGGASRPTQAGGPVVSSWTALPEARNVMSDTAPADEPRVRSKTTFQGDQDVLSGATQGGRAEAGGATATASRTSRPGGRAVPPGAPEGDGLDLGANRSPSIGGGVQALAGKMRRSTRGWKPSTGCLENIAHATRELLVAEEELTKSVVEAEGQREMGTETNLDQTFWLRECSFAAQGIELCPRSHGEAMLLPHAKKVREAEISEYNSHVVNGTFGPELSERDFASGPPLKAVWVYSKSKKDPDRFKARVVMQGFLMKQGLHFNDVHASVPAVASFRAFMVGVASRGRNLEHWDVKTAFLTTKMDCEIDVTLPEAFNSDEALQQGARRGSTRHRVLKVIPGCPQGSRLWHDNLFAFLSKKGFVSVAPQEECLLIERGRPEGIHLLVWTDDICVSFPNNDKQRVRTLFSSMLHQNGVHIGEERGGGFGDIRCAVGT